MFGTCTLINCLDPDKLPQSVAAHQGLYHLLLKVKKNIFRNIKSWETKFWYITKIQKFDPLKYTIDSSNIILCI